MLDFREWFATRSDAECRRLFNSARQFAHKLPNVDADEVLNETWVLFALGRRKLDLGDDPVRDFIGAMRGVVWNMAKKRCNGDFELNDDLDYSSRGLSAEDSLAIRELIDQIFANDSDAKTVWLLGHEGYSQAEIEQLLEIDHLQRDARRKRAERLLNKYRRSARQSTKGLQGVPIPAL